MNLKWFDFLFIGIMICAGLFVWISHINWVDERTYDPLQGSTWDEYAPDDGTDKGLIITPVEIPTN